MRKQIFALALSVLLLALSVPVQAQQAAKFPRIGYLAARSSPERAPKGSAEDSAISAALKGRTMIRTVWIGNFSGDNLASKFRPCDPNDRG